MPGGSTIIFYEIYLYLMYEEKTIGDLNRKTSLTYTIHNINAKFSEDVCLRKNYWILKTRGGGRLAWERRECLGEQEKMHAKPRSGH